MSVEFTKGPEVPNLDNKNNIRIQHITNATTQSRGYSAAVVVDNLQSNIRHVYLAGVATRTPVGDLEGQIRVVWAEIKRVLAAAGATYKNLVTLTSSVKDLDFDKQLIFNKIRREVLGGPNPDKADYPASMLLGSLLAHPDLLVEIQAQAVLKIPHDWKVKPLPNN